MTNNHITHFKSELLHEQYTKIHHKSGLDIYVFPKKLTTTYAIFATRYGSVDTRFKLEGDREFVDIPDGVAHFLEHKMFENEDGTDSFEKFSAYGADANAYTSQNRTAYLFSCTEHFGDSLRELLTYVTHPYFTPKSVAKEQGIIGQEIRMGDDNPNTRRYYNLLSALYHSRRIYTHICGTVESISEITADTLYACHRVFYNLSNMALVVCGNVTVDEVLAIADETLPIQTPVSIIRESEEEPASICKQKVSCQMEVAQPIFAIGIKDPSSGHSPMERARREIAASILCEILFNKTGALYNDLYGEGLIAPGLGYGYDSTPSFARVSIVGESREPDTVFARVMEAAEEARKNGLSRTAFTRCKRVIYAQYIREFDSTSDIADLMLDTLFADIEPFAYAELINTVTLEETEALMNELFRSEAFAMSVVYPKEKDCK